MVSEEQARVCLQELLDQEEALKVEIRRVKASLTFCNLCGLSCCLGDGAPINSYPMGLINAEVSGGYHSTAGNGHGALDDTVTYKFSLCEFCIDWLFEQCVVSPYMSSWTGDTPKPYRPAAQRVQEDEWRQKGKEAFLAAKAIRDAARASKRNL